MHAVLGPGMRLIRRFGVAWKFGVIALVLMIPLSVSLTTGFLASTAQLRATQQEREGLVYTRPLVHLIIQLAQMRVALVDGSAASSVAMTSVADVDGVQGAVGDFLGMQPQWAQLRHQVVGLTRDQHSAAGAAPVATATMGEAIDLLRSVADHSSLSLDPQLDSFYLMRVLTDRLPQVISAASQAEQVRRQYRSGTGTADIVDLRVAMRLLSDAVTTMVDDLETAMHNSAQAALVAALSPPSATLLSAVTAYARDAQNPMTGPGNLSGESLAIAVSAGNLTDTLVQWMDVLLVDRIAVLSTQRAWPVWATLAGLLGAAYLFGALYRATTLDVRTVLSEIGTVTRGALNQTKPLVGRDEFAQMSRAVVYARDRLTSLLGELRYQSNHDELTSLPNRALFTEKLDDSLADGTEVAVLVVDIDGFKDINDSFGHDIGDRVLREVAVRFHRALRRRTLVARMGGDEFAVLLTDVRSPQEVSDTADLLNASLERLIDVDGRRFQVRTSIGVAVSVPDSRTSRDLMRNADVALNAARDRGKGRTAIFETAMHDRTRERTELSADLVQAMARGEMSVLYQPIIDLHTRTVHGAEALVRWHHPTRGPISPTVFVPLAEAAGTIVPLGRWVLQTAVAQLATWRRQFPDSYPLTMDVNLAAAQLADADLVGDVLSAIDDADLDPTGLLLEITESDVVADLDLAMRRLGQLSAMGVRLALDDFGTGYSSLTYLRSLPVDVLKVDKSFVTDSDTDESAAALMRSIVALGTGMGLQIIAEGIETAAHADLLAAAGCHLGQGYLWARPLPAEELTAMLRAGGRPAQVPTPRRATTARNPPDIAGHRPAR